MSNADRDATMYASMREFERTITFELGSEVLPHQSESLLRELGSFCPLILLKYLKQKLSATVPVTGTWKARASLRASMSIQPVGSHHFRGVCMVADVSGFVDLSNLYCSKGVAGVDELQRLIDDYFVEIIDLVYSFGGDVLYIAGDAIICVFESENCCENAVRCGGNLLQHCFPQMRLHVAFAYGDLTLTLLGGCGGCMSYLVTGAPMQDMFSIIGQAGEDEIIVSATFRNEIVARELVALMDITLTPTESGSFKMCLGEVYEVHQPVFERLNFNIDRSLADASRAFLPSLVSSFIGSYELNRCFTELRHVSTLFMRLDSFTTANLDDPLSLQEYFMILQKTLTETQGYMRQFVADDKGLILVAMWGVPSYSSTNNALKALQFALQARSRCQEIGLSTSIGISTGLIFCGIIGADTRRDYIGLGDHVNFAARLMGAAKGRVLLDRSTFSAVPNAAQSCLKLSDDLLLKGLKDPITPYEALPDFNLVISARQDVRGVSKWDEVTNCCTQKIDEIATYDAPESPERAPKIKGKRVKSKNRLVSFVIVIGAQGMGFYDIPVFLMKYAYRHHRHVTSYFVTSDSSDARVPYSCISKLVSAIRSTNTHTELLSVLISMYPDKNNKDVAQMLSDLEIALGMCASEDETSMDHSSTGTGLERIQSLTRNIRRRVNIAVLVLDVVKALLDSTSSVVVLDNAHCVDEASWAILQSLSYIEHGALLFYVVISPTESAATPKISASQRKKAESTDITEEYLGRKIVPLDAICSQPSTKVFFVSSMSLSEVKTMLVNDLNTSVDPDLSKTIYEVTGGNPFWIAMVSNFIKERGMKEVTALSKGYGANSLLKEIVICRFDTLAPEQQILLKDASVLGFEFTTRVLVHISKRTDLLEVLVREGFVLCVDRPAAKYRFQNELMREIVYDLIPATTVATKHMMVARCIEKEFADSLRSFYPLLSFHYLKSHRDDPNAIKYTVKAADHCVREGAFADALLYAEVALLVSSQDSEVATVLRVLDMAIKDMSSHVEDPEDSYFAENGVSIDPAFYSSRHYLGAYRRLRDEAQVKYDDPKTGNGLTIKLSWKPSYSQLEKGSSIKVKTNSCFSKCIIS